MMNRILALLAGSWVGMQLGFAAAAVVLFDHLERITAGNLAGVLFHIVNLYGLAVWLLVYFSSFGGNAYERISIGARRAVALLWLLTAVNEFLIRPVIAAFKAGQSHWLPEMLGGSFGAWHGGSTVIYLIAGVIGIGVCLRLIKLQWH